MDVTRAAGIVRAPFGHEARHDAEARADFLGPGLEQDRPVGGLERLGEQDRGLVDARAGFGVQAFDGDAELAHLDHQRLEEFALATGAQQRVTKHARRDRLRAHVAFGSPRLRRLGEVEPFEFHAAHHAQAQLFGAPEHALEQLPRADRVRNLLAAAVDHELAEKEGHAIVPGDGAMGAEIDLRHAHRESPCASRSAWCCRNTGHSCPSRRRRHRSRTRPRRQKRICPCGCTCRAVRHRCPTPRP